MRLPKRGERGFTLIELLIVVAILGVLAAVVIPNVTRFVGAGEQEAAETELHNIQLAVTSMMLENGITTIPDPLDANGMGLDQTNDMGAFPDITSSDAVPAVDPGKEFDPTGLAYNFGPLLDFEGYRLYGHDITADGEGPGTTPPGPLVNYVTVQLTTYHYTCQADGTVQQWDVNGQPLEWD